jgi:hypothetical protein
MIQVIDNFLPQGYINEIEKLCLSSSMSWEYTPDTTYPDPENKNIWDKQFCHQIISNNENKSQYHLFFTPILYHIEEIIKRKIQFVIRMKVNMTLPIPDTTLVNGIHIDTLNPNTIVAILYVNESDGDTVIYDHKRIEGGPEENYSYIQNLIASNSIIIKDQITPKKNRLVLFSGDHFHEGKMPTMSKNRVALNIVVS